MRSWDRAVAALVLVLAAAAHGDQVRLKNGDVVSGKIVETSDAGVVLEHAVLGKLTIVFSALGLTDEQENRVAEVVSGAFCDTIDAFQFTEDAQQRLKELATRIAELTGGVEGEAEAGSGSPAGGDSPAPTVELF